MGAHVERLQGGWGQLCGWWHPWGRWWWQLRVLVGPLGMMAPMGTRVVALLGMVAPMGQWTWHL